MTRVALTMIPACDPATPHRILVANPAKLHGFPN